MMRRREKGLGERERECTVTNITLYLEVTVTKEIDGGVGVISGQKNRKSERENGET